MKGLILKDYYIIIKQFKAFLLIDLIFFAVSVFGNDNMFFIVYPCILSGIIPMNLVAYDEQSKWEKYAGVLPYSRAQIVSGKYTVGLCVGGATVAATAIVQAFRMIITNRFVLDDYIGLLAGLAVISLLIPAISFPLIFKFGFVKSRIIVHIMIGFFCCIGVSFIHFDKIEQSFMVTLNRYELMPLILVAIVLLYAVSWYFSVQFYKKREF